MTVLLSGWPKRSHENPRLAEMIWQLLLALVQCQLRGIEPGPINTFPKWQDLKRHVKRREKALTLCML